MNGQAKLTTSIAFRPSFQDRLDSTAGKYGVSRSQLITQVLSVVLDRLEQPGKWIQFSRNDFERTLTL